MTTIETFEKMKERSSMMRTSGKKLLGNSANKWTGMDFFFFSLKWKRRTAGHSDNQDVETATTITILSKDSSETGNNRR